MVVDVGFWVGFEYVEVGYDVIGYFFECVVFVEVEFFCDV